DQRQRGKESEEQHVEALLRKRHSYELVHGVHVAHRNLAVHAPYLPLHFFNKPRRRIPSPDGERHKSSPGFVGLRKRGIYSGIRRLIQSSDRYVGHGDDDGPPLSWPCVASL